MPDICLQHCLALLLIDGGLTFASSHDYARMNDAAVRALRTKITLTADPKLPRRAGIVTVTTRDRREFTRHVPHVRGTSSNPMTRVEVETKAVGLMAPVLGAERARALIDAVWKIEVLADARELRPLLQI